MGEKYFEIVWNNQKVEYMKGTSMSDAFAKAGYGGGAFNVIDTWREVSYLSIENKEISVLNSDGKGEVIFYPHEHGTLIDAIREEILKRGSDFDGNTIKINICGREREYSITICAFQIICQATKSLH